MLVVTAVQSLFGTAMDTNWEGYTWWDGRIFWPRNEIMWFWMTLM